jgi:alanyl-tRNA synthetase
LHWALHEIVSPDASQKGSFVGTDKLTFDFSSAPLTPSQLADIERLVNERIVENSVVSWRDMPYSEVRQNHNILQFFGEKYGDVVRVVQIGGEAGSLNGYSMELCGGTHVRHTGEIGSFRIVSEGAVAAGIRRIEAVAGLPAYRQAAEDASRLKSLASHLGTPLVDLERKIEALLQQQKDLDKSLKAALQREASHQAADLLKSSETIGGIPVLIATLPGLSGDALQGISDALKSIFSGVVFLSSVLDTSVSLVASVSSDFTSRVQAGKLIQIAAPLIGGKGGGRPDSARGAGRNPSGLSAAVSAIRACLSSPA